MTYGKQSSGGGPVFFLLIGVVCGIVIVGGTGWLIYTATHSANDSSGVSPVTVQPPAGDSQPADTAASTQPAAPAQPVTVLAEHGNGIKTTESFSVHNDWDLSYSYDCANFGGTGNFAVTVNGSAGDVLVNQLAAKGSDTTHQHDGPGKIALDVNSECAWSLKVIQLPG